MIYFLSPCAYSTSKWTGDLLYIIPEITTVISTAVQMTACESHHNLSRANAEMYPHLWKWCCESAFNLEWMVSLLQCEIEKANRLRLCDLKSYTVVNAVREYQHLFPREDFTYPLDPETERKRYAADYAGRKVYRKSIPPFWLTNRQVVVGMDEIPDQELLDDSFET